MAADDNSLFSWVEHDAVVVDVVVAAVEVAQFELAMKMTL